MNKITQDNRCKFLKKPIFGLILVVIGSIIFKLSFFPLEIPLALDSIEDYYFAIDIKNTDEITINYSPTKIGWPFFLSIIFNLVPSNETFVFMEIQKLSTIVISSLTAIPIFYLSQVFFTKKYGIIAAAIFVFDPRIGINSSLGITDPLFVLILVTSLLLFLRNKEILVYISFFTVGLAATVRPEGIFLFFAMTVLYFIKNRKNGFQNLKYLICFAIFFITLFPVLSYQENIHGNDLVFDRLTNTISYHSQDPKETEGNSGIPFILKGVENFPKYLGWVLIPNFIIFAPIGFILSIKKIDFNKFSLIFSGIFLAMPIFYSYAIPLQDTRYLLTLYPLFSLWSIFTIKSLEERIRIPILLPIMIIIILSSLFLILKYDAEYELETVKVSQLLNETPMVVNNFYPQSRFLEPTNLPKTIEDLKSFTTDREKGKSLRSNIPQTVKVIPTYEVYSIEEFMTAAKKDGLTHIIIEKDNSIQVFSEIYNNENKYPYLKKINDETIYKKFQVKIFEIDYSKLEE